MCVTFARRFIEKRLVRYLIILFAVIHGQQKKKMSGWVKREYSPGALKNLAATFFDVGEFYFIFVCSSCSAAKRFDFSSPL